MKTYLILFISIITLNIYSSVLPENPSNDSQIIFNKTSINYKKQNSSNTNNEIKMFSKSINLKKYKYSIFNAIDFKSNEFMNENPKFYEITENEYYKFYKLFKKVIERFSFDKNIGPNKHYDTIIGLSYRVNFTEITVKISFNKDDELHSDLIELLKMYDVFLTK